MEKILIIAPYPPPFGGQSVLVKSIIESRVSESYDFRLLNISHCRPKKIVRLLYTLLFSVQLLFRLFFVRNIRIVHIHTSAGIAFYEKSIYLILSRLFGKKVMLHIHGGIFRNYWEGAGDVGKALICRILNWSHCVIVLSSGWQNYFSEHVGCDTEVMSLPNAVVVGQPSADELNQDFCTSFLYVGHLKVEKGLLDLLNALNKLNGLTSSPISIRFMGEGDTPESEIKIREAYTKANVHNVEFLGLLTGVEKWHYFAKADVFILPSHSEDMPLTILEAMAFSLPVIATDVGTIHEVIEDGVNGYLVEPYNGQDLSEKMKLLTENSDIRKLMGSRNRQKFLDNYSFQSYEKKLKMIYDYLLDDIAPLSAD